MQAAAAPQVLDDAWRRWIAENLLLGADRPSLVQALTARGCPVGLALAEIEAAAASPYLAGAALLQKRLAKRDWLLAAQARQEALGNKEVPRRPAPDAEAFLADHYATGRPVVLTGLIDHWPAHKSWSLDRLAALPGDTEIEIQHGRDGNAAYEIESGKHKRRTRLDGFVALLRRDQPTNDVYLTANNGGHNRAALAPLWDEIGPLPYLAPDPDRDGFLWIGPRGTITPWHHDLTSNLLVQVVGRKRVAMVSPSQTPLMQNHRHCYSDFAGDAGLAAAPPERRPHPLTCILEPGDTLFIPVGWWHHVEGLEATIGMSFTNFRWPNDFSAFYATYDQV